MDTCDVAVVGAGAAGLAAAIAAGEASAPQSGAARSASIVLLDGATSLGAKILMAGGGRCNVTNAEVGAKDYNGRRTVIRNVLAGFDAVASCRWFASLGVELKREEDGKLFPVDDSARTVLTALHRRCERLGARTCAGHRVHSVRRAEPDGGGFVVGHARGELHARHLILATGGRSLPRTGSDGGGWDIARALGHSVTDTYPALVPLVLASGMFHAELSGLSHPAELSTFADGARIDRRAGSLLWTHFGVSGPVVLDASRHWVVAHAQGRRTEMRCNFLPGDDFERAEAWLLDRAQARPRLSLARCLAERLPERLAIALARRAECDPATPMSRLARSQRRTLLHVLTALSLPVERDRGWDFAEVTAGGVPLDEIDYRTMESRRTPGLHLIGEMLDCDGRIGGFNFQWAWSTGHLAGKAVGRASAERRDRP